LTHEELFSLADKVGLGFIRHASDKDIEKFEGLIKLVAFNEREKVRGQIETLGAMYELAAKQRDELMAQQKADIETMRGRMQ
jgi:ABC-type Fe3+-hydroxamate transport system substrate-binding protein